VNPSSVLLPFGLLASGLVGLLFSILGALSLGRRWPGGSYLLVFPFVLTWLASGLHKYPFHGRLLLFLAPIVHLLVAEGVSAIGRKAGRIVFVVLALVLLAQPATNAVWHVAVAARGRPFDSHGDLWPDLLDYLEPRP
jgi:hypothetical protein